MNNELAVTFLEIYGRSIVTDMFKDENKPSL
jgi:hypothetical protein